MSEELKDKEIQVGDKVIGGNTLIKFNIKTLAWIFGALYIVLGYLYLDLRSELKASVEISNEEKTEFLEDVEDEWDTKLDKVLDITTIIRLDQALMKGDIKVILDRNQRNSAEQPNTNINVAPTIPPHAHPEDSVN